MTFAHGCTLCLYPGCNDYSCPICHPEGHGHRRTKNNILPKRKRPLDCMPFIGLK